MNMPVYLVELLWWEIKELQDTYLRVKVVSQTSERLCFDLKCNCETCLCDHNLVKRKKVLPAAGSENEKVSSRYKVGSRIFIFSTW